MKRTLALICVMLLACCPAAPAFSAGADYSLPDSLKGVPAAAERVSLPADLPEPANITSFSLDGGTIAVELDRPVPRLKIMELDFVKAVESTIFSRKNTASAETHRTGGDSSVFSVLMIWDLDGVAYTQEYNTWSGPLSFSRAGLSEAAAPDAFPGWTSAVRELEFREDGTLLSETWKLDRQDDTFTRTALYDETGELESCTASWRSADYSGYILDAGFAPDGSLISVRCRNDRTDFSAESLPVDADVDKLLSLRDNSYDGAAFEAELRAAYPTLTEILYGFSEFPALAYADLPSTATDLPSTATDLPEPEAEAVPEGEATEDTRIWLISYGDYFESTIYAFASDDPLFILEDGKAVPNPDAKDINGTPVAWAEMNTSVTPAFEAPAAE